MSYAQQETNSRNLKGLPDKIIAGVLDLRYPVSAKQVNIKQAHDDGYNLLIVGYSSIKDNQIGFLDPNTRKLEQTPIILKAKVADAQKENIKTLISINNVEGIYDTDVKIQSIARSIADFVRVNKAVGIVYSFSKYIGTDGIVKVTQEIKKIDPSIVIAINPSVNHGLLVTSANNNDYSKLIKSGDVDYIIVKEYGKLGQNKSSYIVDSYPDIIKKNDIPTSTKILIEEPTTALIGGVNTIYHPDTNATDSISTVEAIDNLLPEIHKFKYRVRFSGMVGNSLNLDYSPDSYGLHDHKEGGFAKQLKNCIYNNQCKKSKNTPHAPVVGGVLSFLDSDVYENNSSSAQKSNTSLSMLIPEYSDYCEKNPDICVYNMVFISYFKDLNKEGFVFDFNNNSDKNYVLADKKNIKRFIAYMNHHGKRVILSMGDEHSRIDWSELDTDKLARFIEYYGFDGINFDLDKNTPKNQNDIQEAATKIKSLVQAIRSKDRDFILSFSPEWQYIISPINKKDMQNIYNDDSYVLLINAVGLDNITYIFLDTYSLKSPYAFFSYEKSGDKYKEVSPLSNYVTFISSLAWALTTDQGYEANKDKYLGDEDIMLPSSKLVFLVDSKKLKSNQVNKIIDKIKENKASFDGFVLANFKPSEKTVLSYEASKELIDAIYAAEFPRIVNYRKPTKPETRKKATTIRWANDKDYIDYPDMLGSYIYGTEVRYLGHTYKCIATDIDMCNNLSYAPNSSFSYFIWEEVAQDIKQSRLGNTDTTLQIELDSTEINYPDKIGTYTDETVVVSGNKKFRCMSGKEKLCNSLKYDPKLSQAYKAWKDISLDNVKYNTHELPVNTYRYPDGIKFYMGGTQVLHKDEIYRCKVGPESDLCRNITYEPSSEYGSDVWEKVEEKNYSDMVSSSSTYKYPDSIGDYVAGTVVSHDGKEYLCEYGNLSKLCKSKYYTPGETKSAKIWSKV
ncbi:glycosyl hydrolase family 18 protein [Francisella sciaenopsi]|uniref:Glycosyl hydrolase family 18 protein n=1 Tax=Francisella sciaenopsi TaxID=3055034 RepID=A0ABQ6PFN7_9GAMM